MNRMVARWYVCARLSSSIQKCLLAAAPNLLLLVQKCDPGKKDRSPTPLSVPLIWCLPQLLLLFYFSKLWIKKKKNGEGGELPAAGRWGDRGDLFNPPSICLLPLPLLAPSPPPLHTKEDEAKNTDLVDYRHSDLQRKT